MAEFDKAKFIEEEVASTAKICAGVLGEDSLEIAGGILDKLNSLYNDILKNATTQEEAEKLLKNSKMSVVFNGAGIFIDLLHATELSSFHYDLFAGTSKEDGKILYCVEDKDVMGYVFKTIIKTAVDFVLTKNIFTAGLSLFTDFITSNHLITLDYYKKNPQTNNDISSNPITERKYILFNADKNFDSALNKVWGNISADMNSLDRVIFTRDDIPVEFIYHKKYHNGELNTFEFRNNSEEAIVSVLKRISYPTSLNEIKAYLAKGNHATADQIIRNCLVNYASNANSVKGDLTSSIGYSDTSADLKITKKQIQNAARYCLKKLEGYALEGNVLKGKEAEEYEDLKIYSQNHMNARLDFFNKMCEKYIQTFASALAGGYYYFDTKTGKFVGDDKMSVNQGGKKVIFVDGSYDLGVSYYDDVFVYGYSGDDNIVAKVSNDRKSTYIEAGLGSDNITTGDANDIIYTNARINDKFDTETADTTNTVNSGAGNDTIYGSNGIDEINAQDGDDWLYGKKGDDILDGGKGIDHIFGGAGSDTIKAESGENYIYTHTDSENGEDLDTIKDTNIVTIKYATKNYIYGGRGIENITIDSGRSHIYTKENDDIVTISNGELNEIYLGAGSDTLTINGGNNNKVYTHKDSQTDTDKDTTEDTNTINITLGRNEIYGGKGIENITIQDGDNVIDTGDGDNVVTITGGKNNITLGSNNDTVVIDGGDNTINGGDGEDNITATSGKNHIDGGIGKDTIITGDGDDTLIGGADEKADELKGGAGDDSYFVDANDIINDSDHIGKVWFNSIARLTGGVETEPNSKTYKGGGYTYHLNGNTL